MWDRRTFLAITVALPVAACATRLSGGGGAMLRVATLNIWHDAGDWTTRQRLIADVLRASDADVIALQEVLEDKGKGLPNQAETLGGLIDGYTVHFTAVDPPGSAKRFGNAILTRLPVIASDSRKLEPLSDYRTALRVRVSVAGRPVDVVVTHLAFQPEAGAVRAQQLADLIDWLPNDDVPLVLLGDFNAPLDDTGLAGLAAHGLDTALKPGTVSTTLVASRGHQPRVIDHIFYEPTRFTADGAELIADQPVKGEYPSDHFGVAARLRLK